MCRTESSRAGCDICLVQSTADAQCVDFGGMNSYFYFTLPSCIAAHNQFNTIWNMFSQTQIGDTLSDSKIDDWVTAYKMRDKMRCSPDARDSLTEPKVVTISSSSAYPY